MAPIVRVMLSVVYWIAAVVVILIAGYVLPGDCFTESARPGFDKCMNEGRAIYIVGFMIALLGYLLIRRIARGR